MVGVDAGAHVRFAPNSDHKADMPAGRFGAISGRSQLMCEVQLKTNPPTAIKEAARRLHRPAGTDANTGCNIAADALMVDW